EKVNRFAGKTEIHRSKGELRAAASLHKNDGVVVRNRQVLAQTRFGCGVDTFKFRRAMAHFHDRHAGTAPIEQFFADAFEYRKWQRTGACVEIENTIHRCYGSTG